MPYLSLSPLTDALLTRLNVPSLLALAPGGVTDDPQQGIDFPFVLLEVREGPNIGGLGTAPGEGRTCEIDLRLHVFSRSDQTITWAANHAVMALCIALLEAAPLVVEGYLVDRFQPDARTTPLQQVVMQGVQVKELVRSIFFYLTETSDLLMQQAAVYARFVRGELRP
jgi:hypothetical protein